MMMINYPFVLPTLIYDTEPFPVTPQNTKISNMPMPRMLSVSGYPAATLQPQQHLNYFA